MQLRADKRSRIPDCNKIREIPIVIEYKYLGVTLDDCSNITPHLAKLKLYRKKYKTQLLL